MAPSQFLILIAQSSLGKSSRQRFGGGNWYKKELRQRWRLKDTVLSVCMCWEVRIHAMMERLFGVAFKGSPAFKRVGIIK